MADKFKIRVTIANRVYPLNISSPNEEEGMRKAARKINELVSQFEQDYAVSDKQDVLAMCALQFASSLEIEKIDEEELINKTLKKLDSLHTELVEKLK